MISCWSLGTHRSLAYFVLNCSPCFLPVFKDEHSASTQFAVFFLQQPSLFSSLLYPSLSCDAPVLFFLSIFTPLLILLSFHYTLLSLLFYCYHCFSVLLFLFFLFFISSCFLLHLSVPFFVSCQWRPILSPFSIPPTHLANQRRACGTKSLTLVKER